MKKLLFFISMSCGILFAQDKMFSTGVKPLYLDATSSKVVGKLLPTTEVTILKKEGDRVLLSIEGYAPAGENIALYFVPNKRILNAGFSKNSGVKFEKIGSTNADGKAFDKLKVQVWSENTDLSDDVKPLFAQAKDLFDQNCSMCHGLHQPKEFSANQWPSMFKSMAGRTGIDKKDYQLVIQYLQKNAKDMPTK